jgi:hypothetical protein
MQNIILKSHTNQVSCFPSSITILEGVSSVQYKEIVDEVNIAWLSLDFQLYLSSSILNIIQCLILLLGNSRKMVGTWMYRIPKK